MRTPCARSCWLGAVHAPHVLEPGSPPVAFAAGLSAVLATISLRLPHPAAQCFGRAADLGSD